MGFTYIVDQHHRKHTRAHRGHILPPSLPVYRVRVESELCAVSTLWSTSLPPCLRVASRSRPLPSLPFHIASSDSLPPILSCVNLLPSLPSLPRQIPLAAEPYSCALARRGPFNASSFLRVRLSPHSALAAPFRFGTDAAMEVEAYRQRQLAIGQILQVSSVAPRPHPTARRPPVPRPQAAPPSLAPACPSPTRPPARRWGSSTTRGAPSASMDASAARRSAAPPARGGSRGSYSARLE